MKIAVLAGGSSPEREISLKSGKCVAAALRQKGHTVALLDPACPPSCGQRLTDTDFLQGGVPHATGRGYFAPALWDLLAQADVVFSVLHGGEGEDGTVAAILGGTGIPFAGSDHRGCLLSTDKALSAALLQQAGIPIPRRYAVDHLSFPCIAKPRFGGSSIGVHLLQTTQEACTLFQEKDLLWEEYIRGREFSVAILGNHALPPAEIITKASLFDYQSKYRDPATQELCPAPLSLPQTRLLCDLALRAHHALFLSHYSRIDFLRSETGEFYCLEANALPGMTERSLYPRCAAAAGIDFPTLCEQIAVMGAAEQR